MALKAPRDQQDHQAHQARRDWWYIHIQTPPPLLHIFCFSLLSVILFTFSTLGSTWYWRNWWKGWKTRVAGELRPSCPHTWGDATVRYSLRRTYSTWPLPPTLVSLSGRSRPSRPTRNPRNPSEYHLSHLHDLIWFSVYLAKDTAWIKYERYGVFIQNSKLYLWKIKTWQAEWCVLIHIYSLDIFNHVNSLFYISKTVPCYCLLLIYFIQLSDKFSLFW